MIRTFQKLSVGLAVGAVSAAVLAQATPERPPAPVGLAPQPAQPEFENIFTTGEDGMPVPPSTWLDIAALPVNPTIPADLQERVEEGVRAWLADVQRLVIENPDLALEAAQGLFDGITIEARAELAHASEVMKALGSVTNLSSYLVTEGVLSNDQGETNRRIVQQYVRARSEALSNQVMQMSPDEQQQQMQLLMARTTMTSLTDDAMRMFKSVAVRGAAHAGEAVREAGLDASRFSTELQAVRDADSDDAKYEAMMALMEAMEGMELFRFAEALAPRLPAIQLPGLAGIGELHQDESREG
ncbi:MAG: hypothetical protein RIE77_11940 [Phycisphaerales bacterium]|jgi:hypothetical protein